MAELGQFLPLVLIVAAFWFLVIRPARKRTNDMNRLQASVEVGSHVMLGSGIFGTVVGVETDNLQLEVAPGTVLKVARQAVVRVVKDDDNARSEPRDERSDDSPNVIDEQ